MVGRTRKRSGSGKVRARPPTIYSVDPGDVLTRNAEVMKRSRAVDAEIEAMKKRHASMGTGKK